MFTTHDRKLAGSQPGSVDTYGVHDGVSQHHVADVDPGDEADETRNDVRVVDIYGLGYGLEAK